MSERTCSAEGCDATLWARNRSGFCRACTARRSLSETLKKLHQNPVFAFKVSQRMTDLNRKKRGSHMKDAEFQARAKAAQADKWVSKVLASLDATGKACFDRCVAGGLDMKMSAQLARDEMRIYAKAAANRAALTETGRVA